MSKSIFIACSYRCLFFGLLFKDQDFLCMKFDDADCSDTDYLSNLLNRMKIQMHNSMNMKIKILVVSKIYRGEQATASWAQP